MKVFWKDVNAAEAEVLVDKAGVEELYLPAEATCKIRQVLEESSGVLPPSARTFQDWRVGLMERYEA